MHQMTKTQALAEIQDRVACGLLSEAEAQYRRQRIQAIASGTSNGRRISWAQQRRLYAINAG